MTKYKCPHKSECQMTGCLDDKNCYVKELIDARNNAEKDLESKKGLITVFAKQNNKMLAVMEAFKETFTKIVQVLHEPYNSEENETEEVKRRIRVMNELLTNTLLEAELIEQKN